MKKQSLFLIIILIMASINCQQWLDKEDTPISKFLAKPSNEVIVYGFKGKIWKMKPDGMDNEIFIEADFPVYGPRWSPDRTKIAFMGTTPEGTSIWIANANGENKRQITQEDGYVGVTWVNSELLLTSVVTPDNMGSYQEKHFILKLNDGTLIPYSNLLGGSVKVLPQGTGWITWHGAEPGLTLYDLNGQPKTIFSDWGITGGGAFTISPSGDEIVFQGGAMDDLTSAIYRARFESDEKPEKILDRECCVALYWSLNGKKIAIYSLQNYSITIVNNETFKPINVIEPEIQIDNLYGWSPDSKYLLALADYSNGREKRNFELVKIDIETGEIFRLTHNDGRETGVDWVILE